MHLNSLEKVKSPNVWWISSMQAVVLRVAQYLKLEDFKSFHKTNERTNIGFDNILKPGNSPLTCCQ